MTELIADNIEAIDWSNNEDAKNIFDDLTPKVNIATQTLAPNLFSGHQAYKAIVTFILSLKQQIESQLKPEQISDLLLLPVAVQKSVKAAKLRLKTSNEALDGIDEKLHVINRAYDAAERLPATQDDITQALAEISAAKSEANALIEIARQSQNTAETQEKKLILATEQAQKTLEKLEDAYRVTISQGLAKSFADKAKKLNLSMVLWFIVLLSSLIAGGIISHNRFPEILRTVTTQTNGGILAINIILGVITLAPTIWLAWVSTKQIGQRFRLSEDYAYKAALSAAYEGYRSEAARLDPLFEARLFSTALGRLDELPLRLIETNVHGSPLHEFLSSPEFKKATELVPEVKERLIQILHPSKPKSTNLDIPKSSD